MVLSDVYFNDGNGTTDQLDRIIEVVRTQAGNVPIIAYTGRRDNTLDSCLKRKEKLYDIWDKNTASPAYIAWRVSELAATLSRNQPSARLQRLVRKMPQGATWHEHVLKMAEGYDSGKNERDQIVRAGKSIEDIAGNIDIWAECQPLWEIMTEWEPMSRLASRSVRGHARHVINVFWMGYYLLHHELLTETFEKLWKKLVAKRAKMDAVENVSSLEALSNAWFLAGLFHDIGGCAEKYSKVRLRHEELLTKLDIGFVPSTPIFSLPDEIMPRADDIFVELDAPLKSMLPPAFNTSNKLGYPDHGVVAAVHIRQTLNRGQNACYAREAARGMAIHNMFPELARKAQNPIINWDQDPLACLLLLCDQIQTWDRERDDATKEDDDDSPKQAELSTLKVEMVNERPHLTMDIDYIAPPHLKQGSDHYDTQKTKLQRILRANPEQALKKVGDWPFSVKVNCFLSGDPLHSLHFGDSE